MVYDLTGDGGPGRPAGAVDSVLIDRQLLTSIASLRVKELTGILMALGMPKTGPKPELVRRLTEMGSSAILVRHAGGKPTVENVIKHAHRQLAQERGQNWDETRPSVYWSGANPVRGEKRPRDHPGPAPPAAARAENTPDPGVWARVLACDPFWAAADVPKLVSTPGVVMSPTRMTRQNGASQSLQRPFVLTAEQYFLLQKDAKQHAPQKREYQLQISCVLIDDPVMARLHWPFTATLRVNQAPLPVMYRNPGNAMGKAGRDPVVEVPLALLAVGQNSLFMSCADRRSFSLVIRIAKRRSLDQVKGLVPAPAGFPAARAFVERALGGAGAGDDDDDMIVEDNAILSLRCPISGQICVTPARTKKCTSLAVFDLDTYIKLNEGVRKWTCPHCGAEGRPGDVVVDGFLTRVLGVLRARSRDGKSTNVSRVEVEPSGRWRPVAGDDGGPPGNANANGAPWVETDAMNGVVLGLGGSVLHVPPELREASGEYETTVATHSTNYAGDVKPERRDGVVATAGVTPTKVESGDVLQSETDEESDEEEEMRRAVLEARRGRPPPLAPEDDVIVIGDSDSDEAQEAPSANSSDDHEAMAEAAATLHRERERAAAANAAVEASAAAMVAVETAAHAIAASFRAAQDTQRLNSPQAYSALASAYYDQRSSVSAAEASRSRVSTGTSVASPLGAARPAGEARVSTAAALAVPSPLDISRGAGGEGDASGSRPPLKIVMRRPAPTPAIAGQGEGNAEIGQSAPQADPFTPAMDQNMERWFNSEFGGGGSANQ
jgi:hypothetical protein